MSYRKEYHLKNKEKINRQQRESYYRNRKKRLNVGRIYRLANPEIIRERKKKYNQANKKIITAKNVEWQKNRWKEILDYFGNECGRCGFDVIPALHIHHNGKKRGKRDFMVKSYDI